MQSCKKFFKQCRLQFLLIVTISLLCFSSTGLAGTTRANSCIVACNNMSVPNNKTYWDTYCPGYITDRTLASTKFCEAGLFAGAVGCPTVVGKTLVQVMHEYRQEYSSVQFDKNEDNVCAHTEATVTEDAELEWDGTSADDATSATAGGMNNPGSETDCSECSEEGCIYEFDHDDGRGYCVKYYDDDSCSYYADNGWNDLSVAECSGENDATSATVGGMNNPGNETDCRDCSGDHCIYEFDNDDGRGYCVKYYDDDSCSYYADNGWNDLSAEECQ